MSQHLRPTVDDKWTNRNIRCYMSKEYPDDVENVTSLQDFREFLQSYLKKSEEEVRTIISSVTRYAVKTVTGFVKNNCLYNAACNIQFQSPAACGAKLMLWNLTRAGFKIVDFIHDEVIVELDVNEHIQERLKELQDIMCSSMSVIVKNVKIRAAPALMSRWKKEAEPLYDGYGKLLLWSADIEFPAEWFNESKEVLPEILALDVVSFYELCPDGFRPVFAKPNSEFLGYQPLQGKELYTKFI